MARSPDGEHEPKTRGRTVAVQNPNHESDIWDREYSEPNVIPSSTRESPSKALLLFSEVLRFGEFKHVLDSGCGSGRNTVYLASKGCRVCAVDFSEAALDRARNMVTAAGFDARVQLLRHSLLDRLPFRDGSFDLIVDSYVFCHFIDPGEQKSYRDEMARLLSKGGILFCSAFSPDDEYYRGMVNDEQQRIILDPANGIRKRLYSDLEFKEFFAERFHIKFFVRFEFDDRVRDSLYKRSVIVTICEGR